jgi:hypothetical protein
MWPFSTSAGILPVEEREEQRADVRAVHVRVGHDDDAVVAQLLEVELVLADAGAERRDERRDLHRREHLVEARLLDVQDLALERQDRLVLAVAALLGGAARPNRPRRGRARKAPGSRSWQSASLPGRPLPSSTPLRPRELARLAGRLARARRLDDLRADDLASAGFSRRNSPSFWPTTSWTIGSTSDDTSLSFVCEENLGSGPSRTARR